MSEEQKIGETKNPPKASASNAEASTNSVASRHDETIQPHHPRLPKEEPSIPPGTRFGRYEIQRMLGQGGMGTVYLAGDTQLQRQVALKVPNFRGDAAGTLLERFHREARAAATLRHPNICPVYDVGDIDGRHYLSMAYIEGRALDRLIDAAKSQSERQILIAIRKLALALQEAHEQGIVHRDLKPANIMVDRRGEPIVMDFGLARHVNRESDGRITHSGMLIGSPAYMSPEQVEGEPDQVGPASDQYSLGVILYEMLTCELPFRGSMGALLGQIVMTAPPSPTALRADLDPRIEAACLKMLSKTPADRFASMQAVADCLADILKRPGASKVSSTGLTVPATDSQVHVSELPEVSASQTQSLEELARKTYRTHDYEQAVRILESIPERLRTEASIKLLAKARDKHDQAAYLTCEFEEAVRIGDDPKAARAAAELLRIKPGHAPAREFLESATPRGVGGRARIGKRQVAWSWSEGGWIPWSALLFGVGVFVVVLAYAVSYLRHEKPAAAPQMGTPASNAEATLWELERSLDSPSASVLPKAGAVRSVGAPSQKTELLRGHTAAIVSLEISPDSRWIATCSRDETVRLWDADSGRDVRTIRGDYQSITFSPDSNELLQGPTVANKRKEVVRTRVADGAEAGSIDFDVGKIRFMAFHPDGKLLLLVRPKNVTLWDVQRRTLVRMLEKASDQHWVTGFSSDGRFIVGMTAANELQVWQTDTGKHVKTVKRYAGDRIAIVPNASLVLCGAWSGGAQLIDYVTGETTATLGDFQYGGSPRGVAVSPDGRFALIGSDDRMIRLFDVAARKEVQKFGPHGGSPFSIRISRDGRFAVSACDDTYVDKNKLVPTTDFDAHVWRLPTSVAQP